MNTKTPEHIPIEEDYFRGNHISIITLNGKGYAKLKTLADFYDVSKSEIEKRLKEFQKSHDVEVIEWSRKGNVKLVSLTDFHRLVWEFSGKI